MKRSVISSCLAVYVACIIGLFIAGCSYTKGSSIVVPSEVPVDSSAPTGKLSAQDVAALSGEWVGNETATVGESGTLTAVFGDGGVVNLTWKSATTTATATGTATGSLSALSITSSATRCAYSASAVMSADLNTITGSYTGSGPGICPTKKGTFQLTRKTLIVDVCPNIEGVQQSVPEGYELKDGQCVKKVAPQCPASFSYSGANPFSLANSGDATELAYVQANVSPKLSSVGKITPGEVTSWTSDGNYAVVLVKAADSYYLYLNVTAGQVLQSQSFNKNGKQQAISHVSRFRCVEVQ